MNTAMLRSSDTLSDGDVRRLERLWWVPLALGVGWMLLAFVILQFNTLSVATISWILGLVLLAAAVNEFADVAISPGWKWLHALVGVVFVAGGIAALAWPGVTFLALANLVGWYLLIKGTFDVVVALSMRHTLDLWGLTLVMGVLELVLAFWAVGYTGRSAALLVLWVGLGAVSKGVTNILIAFQVRRLGPAARRAVTDVREDRWSTPETPVPAQPGNSERETPTTTG